MKKQLCTISLLMILSFKLFSQQEERQFIHLKAPVPIERNDGIASIEIIDNTTDSEFIGVIPSSDLQYTRTNLYLDSGTENSLKNFIQQQFAVGFKKAGIHLLWAINSLSAGIDSSQAGNMSYVKLNADIYSSVSNRRGFRYKSNFDTLILMQNVVPDFSGSIGDALTALYNQSVSDNQNTGNIHAEYVPANLSANDTALDESVIANSYIQQSNHKILQDKIYPSGIYASYQEFLNNAPSITNFYVGVDTVTHKVTLDQLNSDTTFQTLPNAWGISVHNELYCYKNGQLYPIEKKGSGFMLSKYVDYEKRKNNAQFWRITVGKKQGDSNPFNDQHVCRISAKDSTVQIETTHLDMKTGNLTF